MSRRALVTGGAGFIGSHLVDHLLSSGWGVTVIDDLSTGNLSNLSSSFSRIKFIKAAVQDLDLTQVGSIDTVFHLAAQASVPKSITDFLASSENNIISSLKVIDFCKEVGASLIYASSSAVYGNSGPGRESGGVDLLSPYSADKFVLEIYAQVAFKTFGLRSLGFRFFNVYGPRQDPTSPYSGVISIFLDRLRRSLPLVIYGGYQTRDFVYVGDVVRLLERASHSPEKFGGAGVLNLLSGVAVSIDQLAEDMGRLLSATLEIDYRELSPADPVHSEGAVDRMNNFFDNPQMTSLADGLAKLISWK